MGDDGERDRGGEHAHAIGEGTGEQKHAGGGAARERPEATLQTLIGRVLGAIEIAGQQERGDGDPADQIPERHLEPGEVGARPDAGEGNDGDGRRLGGDDGQHDRPPGQAAVSEKVVARVPLPTGEQQASGDDRGEIHGDDRDVDGPHRSATGKR